MNYKISEVAKIAGISTRTLRYYDQIELLKPQKDKQSKYRIYNDEDFSLLQQIQLFKRLGFQLDTIKSIVHQSNFNFESALIEHKNRLEMEAKQISIVLHTIHKTLKSIGGDYTMKNESKFEGLKTKTVLNNELQYGPEIRENYGDSTIDASNQKFQKMTAKEFKEAKKLELEILDKLQVALSESPESKAASEVCALHQKWIQYYWPTYSVTSHLNLVQMYTEDQRFVSYYEKAGKGAADFLLRAMKLYLQQNA